MNPKPSPDLKIFQMDMTTFAGMQVTRPAEVILAEQSTGPGTDDEIVRTLTAFNVGVAKCSRLVRQLLPEYGGYECKEPEPGKFTLAFRWGTTHPLLGISAAC